MPFNNPVFLFCFLPVFFGVYFALPSRNGLSLRNAWALFASLGFYSYAEPRFVFAVLASGYFDWRMGWIIHRTRSPGVRAWCVRAAVAGNLLLLAYFKYVGFFLDSANTLLHGLHMNTLPVLQIALPVGISFMVFEKITYVVDIHRGSGPPAPKFRDYLLYIMLFPKFLAGPIIKYHDISDQLANRRHSFGNIRIGIGRFALGLAKKVLIADVVAVYATQAFDHAEAGTLGMKAAAIGILCYTIQIYFDFSGYSDMAIGLGRMMGFRFMENFNLPYISRNFTEFWRRWHISLGTWIREYLYLPLGGNRCSTPRLYFNLSLCFFLSGLWHGASWNFVAWGLFHGFFMTADRVFWIKAQQALPRPVNIAITMSLIMISWILFRSETLSGAMRYLQALAGRNSGPEIPMTPDIVATLILGLGICAFPLVREHAGFIRRLRLVSLRRELEIGAALALFLLAFGRVAVGTFSPFIYFRF